MNEDCLKLTAYFGERDRVGGRFLADALLDICERQEVATSVLLRGVEGFGLKHHLRSDLSLTLSEDLPVVTVAVDTRDRIEAVLEEARALDPPGLLTLERARMLTDEIGVVTLPGELHEATKLTVYVGRQEQTYGVPAFVAVCDLLHRRGIDGATAMLGVDGTARGHRTRARFFGSNPDVPVMIIAVGSGERIGQVLPELGALVRQPLVTLERIRVCKRDGELLETPHPLPGEDEHGLAMWQKLMVYTSSAAHHARRPIHRALTRELRTSGASGITSLRGIWGFHGEHAPHGDRVLQLARHVPTLSIVVDEPRKVAASFEVIDELTRETGLVTSEMVPAMRARSGASESGGFALARHRY